LEGGEGEEEGGLQEPDPEAGLTHVGMQVARQHSKLEDPELSLPMSSEHVTPETSCHDHIQRASSSPVPQTPANHHSNNPTHSSPAHLLTVGHDEVDRGPSFKKSFFHLTRSHRDKTSDSTLKGLSKKPSVLSVVFGSQYNNSINQGGL
jgi:hypothetical protein